MNVEFRCSIRTCILYFIHSIVSSFIFVLFFSLCIIIVAVVFAFFLCWAPFHAQRLVAFYLNDHSIIYAIVTYTSGVLYYLSTCINPLLYNLMSNKFREAFKVFWFWWNTMFILGVYVCFYNVVKLGKINLLSFLLLS